MPKKIINYFVGNRLEKIAATLLFSALGFLLPVSATTVVTPAVSISAGGITTTPPSSAVPIWGRLVLTGNTVTCYYALGAATPKLWIKIGVSQTIDFINNPILIGMYIASDDGSSVSTGTIDNFWITPAATYRLADYDIGAPTLMGSANLINGVWNLSGSGACIWATSDQCNFQSWLVWGDCTVICRVTSLSVGPEVSKIGIMLRDGFNSGSDYALFCAKGGGGVDFQFRRSFNDNADITEFVAPPAPGVKSGVAVGYGLTGGTSYTVRP
jgi:hypothetical protein